MERVADPTWVKINGLIINNWAHLKKVAQKLRHLVKYLAQYLRHIFRRSHIFMKFFRMLRKRRGAGKRKECTIRTRSFLLW